MAILAEIIFEKEKGINKISLVARPAIEVDFLKFAEEHEIKFTINNDLQIVTGPILIPNRNYYRGKDYFGGDESGYVFFSQNTIKKLGIDYIKNAKNSINIEHKDDLQPNDVDLVESWYIESDHDKAYDLGFSKTDCPVGTWMMSQHINNSDLWAEIKNNKYNGFSIQGFLSKNIIGTGLDMKKEYSEDEIANIIVGLCLAETIIEIKITTDDNAKTNIIDTNAPVNIPVGNITGNTNNTGGKVTANANSNISGDTNASTGSTTGSTRQVNGTIDNTTGTTGQTGSTAIKMAKIIKFANQSGSGVTTAEDNQNNLIKGKNKSYVMRAREDSAVTDNDLMKYQLKWNTPEERKKAVEEWKRRQAAPESVQLSQESEKPIIKPIVENNKDNSLLSMTAPRKGESKKDYIPRCVKYLMDKGEAKDNDQAVAMCYSAWGKESKMSFVEKIQDIILTLGMPDNYPNSDVYPNMNNYGGSVQIRRSLDKTSKKKQDDAQSRAINKKKIEEQAQADAKVKADIAINNTLNKLKNKMPAKQLQMGAPMGNDNAAKAHEAMYQKYGQGTKEEANAKIVEARNSEKWKEDVVPESEDWQKHDEEKAAHDKDIKNFNDAHPRPIDKDQAKIKAYNKAVKAQQKELYNKYPTLRRGYMEKQHRAKEDWENSINKVVGRYQQEHSK